jgi:hypothetical protein
MNNFLLVRSLLLKLLLALIVGLPDQVVFAQQLTPTASTQAARGIVGAFLLTARADKNPDSAGAYMADTVLSHQLNAEKMVTVERTPQHYADHIKEFLKMYGSFSFQSTEFIT